tara:strand:+ start:427 stop:804 length:378 start_codon:yes stop_codon:yes gene_type:complete
MDDFKWAINHLANVSDKVIKKGTAWILCGVDETNVYDVHKYLYDIGFTYATNQLNNEVEVVGEARVISCIFSDNIERGTITYSSYPHYDSNNGSVDIAKGNSGESELNIFKWYDGFCLFQEKILL